MVKQDSNNVYICKNDNWMHYGWSYGVGTWYMSPFAYSDAAYDVWFVEGDGDAGARNASFTNAVFPAIYLKSNVLIESGNGTSDSPYILKAGA